MDPIGCINRPVFVEETFESAAQNVAAEQILLELAEASPDSPEFLRIWRPASPMVVLGRGGSVEDDVHIDLCDRDNIPVIRRISGGGTIVSGPGCLMYTVVLSLDSRPGLRDIGRSHEFVGQKLQQAYGLCDQQIELRGHSDLCSGNRKFSGNAMRLGRTHLIYHGTLLIEFDLSLISTYLKQPPRQPDYRESRDHLDFVTNLFVDEKKLVEGLKQVFDAKEGQVEFDEERIHQLVADRYENRSWNRRF